MIALDDSPNLRFFAVGFIRFISGLGIRAVTVICSSKINTWRRDCYERYSFILASMIEILREVRTHLSETPAPTAERLGLRRSRCFGDSGLMRSPNSTRYSLDR